MERRKLYRKILLAVFGVYVVFVLALSYWYVMRRVPDHIRVLQNKEEKFSFDVPVAGELDIKEVGALNINNKVAENEQFQIDFSKPFVVHGSTVGQYDVDLKLFGVIRLKQIKLDVVEPVFVQPWGLPVGIYVKTDGILVIGTGRIQDEAGAYHEPAQGKVQTGDYIKKVNHQRVDEISQLVEQIEKTEGENVIFEIEREEKIVYVTITPVKNAKGEYKSGIWVRNSTQGIGTITYLDKNGNYAALGHGITDIDTNELMKIGEGSIFKAHILTIIKGKSGNPGELMGIIQKSNSEKLGTIYYNSQQGIFGTIELLEQKPSVDEMEIALRQEVQTGKAYLRMMLENETIDYEIEILKVERGNTEKGKEMMIQITDQRLLELTGGIVQGMSGSPIIQNNKLVGAVTHVFVRDETKGYGIFAETMLEQK